MTLGPIVAIVLLIAGAALAGWLGLTLARRVRATPWGKSLQMGRVMMGVFFDPPTRRQIEAKAQTAEDDNAAGDPPTGDPDLR